MLSLRSYPVLVGAVLQSALALALALGAPLSRDTTGIVEACVAFAAGLALAIVTRPFSVPILTGIVNALIVALATYGVPHVTVGLVSIVDALIVALAAFFVHSQVSPVAPGSAPVRPVAAEPVR